MGWHPTWFHCKNCGVVYLGIRPSTCMLCGSSKREFGAIYAEDVFSLLNWEDPHSGKDEFGDSDPAVFVSPFDQSLWKLSIKALWALACKPLKALLRIFQKLGV